MAESDFSDRLNQLLSNPDALAQVMKLAQNFMPMTTAAPVSTESADDEAKEVSAQPVTLSDSTSADGAQSDAVEAMKLIGKGPPGPPPHKPHGDEKRLALLKALRPYLKHERAEKIDMFLNVLQISQLARGAFGFKH